MNEFVPYDGPDWVHVVLAVGSLYVGLLAVYQEWLIRQYEKAKFIFLEDDPETDTEFTLEEDDETRR